MTTPSEQFSLFTRNCEALYSEEELLQKLNENKPLRVKLGLDPTAPDIHLGHSIVLKKVRQFQDYGHKAVIIIGDYTARIGDPTGKNSTRPILTSTEIEANAKTYISQAGKILDTSLDKLEVRRNSEWLSSLDLAELLNLASQMTVAQMMERDTFKKRFKSDTPIRLHEFFYPLMQAYDSVCIEADIELGGNDQTFNNLCGRTIQRHYGQSPQVVLTMPILVGLDGIEKMSKSKNNYISIMDSPNEMFGKIMSIADSLMSNYYTHLNDTFASPISEEEMLRQLDPNQTHPKQAKINLAKKIVETYYDSATAEDAESEFNKVFAEHNAPVEMPEVVWPVRHAKIVDLMIEANFASSKKEARRLVQSNAVSINQEKVIEDKDNLPIKTGDILRVGKRRFGKIRILETCSDCRGSGQVGIPSIGFPHAKDAKECPTCDGRGIV